MITWYCKQFRELTIDELYAILQLRSEVFVVEQNCIYHDPDGKDPESYHYMALEDGKLVAYTRILPPGLAYPETSIGRVVISATHRGKGVGRELMLRSIEACRELFGEIPIHISAQTYLQSFYNSLGFHVVGDAYMDDGIEHIGMLRAF
jgi:ElaA protein